VHGAPAIKLRIALLTKSILSRRPPPSISGTPILFDSQLLLSVYTEFVPSPSHTTQVQHASYAHLGCVASSPDLTCAIVELCVWVGRREDRQRSTISPRGSREAVPMFRSLPLSHLIRSMRSISSIEFAVALSGTASSTLTSPFHVRTFRRDHAADGGAGNRAAAPARTPSTAARAGGLCAR